MKSFATYMIVLSVVVALGAVLFVSQPAAALTLQDGINAARPTGVPSNLFGGTGIISTLVNILLFIVGALSVIMLIIGGLRYAVSGGNSGSVTAAKNTILYAIVGLVVALLAFAAVNFVMSALGGGFGGLGGQAGWTDV